MNLKHFLNRHKEFHTLMNLKQVINRRTVGSSGLMHKTHLKLTFNLLSIRPDKNNLKTEKINALSHTQISLKIKLSDCQIKTCASRSLTM